MIEIPLDQLVELVKWVFAGLVVVCTAIVITTKGTTGFKDLANLVASVLSAIGKLFRGSDSK